MTDGIDLKAGDSFNKTNFILFIEREEANIEKKQQAFLPASLPGDGLFADGICLCGYRAAAGREG